LIVQGARKEAKLLAEQNNINSPSKNLEQGVSGGNKIPDMEGRCATAFVGMPYADGDLDVSRTLLKQERNHIRLETESIGIGMPAEDVIAQMHCTPVVVIYGIAA
jgi:hypothetical protein